MRVISRFFIFAGALALAACGGGSSNGGGADNGSGDPQAACSADACGPRPQMPNHPCPDGVTVAGPSCEREGNGRCAWVVRECPVEPAPGGGGGAAGGGAMCGGIAGVACPAGQFCAYARDARCGAGDQSGTCQPQPEVCAEIYQPVCGCDGRTYGNECDASRAGVSVASDGECAGGGAAGGGAAGGGERACGSRGLGPCGGDEFCDWPQGANCGRADAPGVCRTRPQMCTREFRPVCGCDGQTYPTACVANSSGVSVEHDGPC